MKQVFEVPSSHLGGGPFLIEWGKKGSILAVVGRKRTVVLFGKDGRELDSFSLQSANVQSTALTNKTSNAVNTLRWNEQGTMLAALPAASDFFFVWNAATSEAEMVQCGAHIRQQELSSVAWSLDGATVILGSSKGGVLMYSVRERKIMHNLTARHEKAIVCAEAAANAIVSGSYDRRVALTAFDGSNVREISLKEAPAQIAVRPAAAAGSRGARLSIVPTGKSGSLLTYDMQALRAGTPTNGATSTEFPAQYGAVVQHFWYEDGNVSVVFSSGRVVGMSVSEAGETSELLNPRVAESCGAADFCAEVAKLAVVEDHKVHIISIGASFKPCEAEQVTLAPTECVHSVRWTPNGQLLAVATADAVYGFLGAVPCIHSASGPCALFLTSLSEACVRDYRTGAAAPLPLPVEPHFVALGAAVAAVGVNNCAHFLALDGGAPARTREYGGGTVACAQLSGGLAALLIGGRVTVHPVDFNPHDVAADDVTVPKKARDVTAFALAGELLVVGTARGALQHYHVWPGSYAPLNEYKLEAGRGVARVWAPEGAAHIVFLDTEAELRLFSPVLDQVLAVPVVAGKADAVVFDAENPNVFVVAEGRLVHVCRYAATTIRGPTISVLASFEAMKDSAPVLLYGGRLVLQLASGHVTEQRIECLQCYSPDGLGAAAEEQRRCFRQAIALLDVKHAWHAAAALDDAGAWQELGEAALFVLETDTAIAAYRRAGDAAMVLSLEDLAHIEDLNLLCGHALVLLARDYDAAEALFLRSSDPRAALEMWTDLRRWERAVALARELDPAQLADIMCQHASMLEMQGDPRQAVHEFQEAMKHAGTKNSALLARCQAGLARCAIESGDARTGVRIALQLGKREVTLECAALLEAVNNYMDAAELYERCGDAEKAAAIYIQAKAFAKAAPLMKQIRSSALHLAFAKAKESEGRFQEAADAYDAAGDADAVVRLCLGRLANTNKAFAVARRSRSRAAAAMVARFCEDKSNWPAAVEFLMLAGEQDRAWQVAQTHSSMDAYSAGLGGDAPAPAHARVARHWQNVGEFGKAAAAYEAAGQRRSAVAALMKVGPEEKAGAVKHAIALVKAAPPAEAPALAQLVCSAIDSDDLQRFSQQVFVLNVALGNFNDASLMATEAAVKLQRDGEYKAARQQLLDAHRQLREAGQPPSQELVGALALLHSYMLVKARAKLGDHVGAARLLKRVFENISRFERHEVPILTSTVVECQRAGLKRTAYDVASRLMRKETRDLVPATHKRKLESMIRKPDRSEDPEDDVTPCCWCQTKGPHMELQCGACQNQIPFCIATGGRMTVDDWTECTHCQFPARLPELRTHLEASPSCPLCGGWLNAAELRTVKDPLRGRGQVGAQNQSAGMNL